MYHNKKVEVRFVGCAEKCYTELIATVEKEKAKGLKNSDNQKLLNSILRHVEILKNNPVYGRSVKKALIPKCYPVQHLWIIDLVGYWRMMYTLTHNGVEIQAIVLEFLNHDGYNKRFGFKG